MKTLTEKQGVIYTNDNDVLFVKGSTGTITFRTDEYEASRYDGAWHYEIESDLFEKKVAEISLLDSSAKSYETTQENRKKIAKLHN